MGTGSPFTVADVAREFGPITPVLDHDGQPAIREDPRDVPAAPEPWDEALVGVVTAWDEGYHAGHEDARAVQPTYPDPTPSPYRQDSEWTEAGA